MQISHEVTTMDLIFRKIALSKRDTHFHWHENLEIIIPLDMPFGVYADGVQYEVKKGDVVLIGGQIIHQFTVDYDDTNILLGQFPYHILLKSGVAPQPIKPVITREEIDEDKVYAANLQNIFDIIEREKNIENSETSPFLQSMYAGLYFLLMEKFAQKEDGNAVKKEKQEFFKIAKFVNEHFDEEITVQSIAQRIYMDRGKLSRLFLKYSNMKLNDYINTLRVNKANKLISEGFGITQAAMESGFQSVRTFNDVYKKMMNKSPRENLGKKNKDE